MTCPNCNNAYQVDCDNHFGSDTDVTTTDLEAAAKWSCNNEVTVLESHDE